MWNDLFMWVGFMVFFVVLFMGYSCLLLRGFICVGSGSETFAFVVTVCLLLWFMNPF